MRDVRIRTKVVGGFTAAMGVAIAVGIGSYWASREVTAQLDTVSSSQFPVYRALAGLTRAQRDGQKFLANLAMSETNAEVMRAEACAACHQDGTLFSQGADDALAAVDKAIAQVDTLPQTDAVRRHWPATRNAVAGWVAQAKLFRDVVRAHGGRGSSRVWEQWRSLHQLADPLDRAIASLDEAVRAEAEASHLAATAAQRRQLSLQVAVLAFGAVLTAGVAYLIGRSVSRAIAAILGEARKLTRAATAGDLDVRGDGAAVSDEFRPIVEGMNDTVEAFAKPVRLTAQYVLRISKGDLPSRITEQYQGEFAAIQSSLNALIDVVELRNADLRKLAEATLAGRLDERADTAKYTGYNGRLIGGINAMLDAALAPIHEATEVLERLAQRDLRARVAGEYRGDHARIKDALNATARALEEAIGQVAQSAGQVSSAAAEIASSSEAVAAGASQQASAIEETSSSLETMTGLVRRSADSAQEANALAHSARELASAGATAMQRMTASMKQIRTAAESTSQIIKDINEITFQTNLLALNAAVEAARAGDAGRGFAVVAEEVRSLAHRSKEAASKTEALIRESVRLTGDGDTTAEAVSTKLTEITSVIIKVTDLVDEIAAAAREQAGGIDGVGRAVEEMNRVTQQNAASAEESSSAATELSSQSEELAALVGSFQHEHAAAPAGSSPRAGSARAPVGPLPRSTGITPAARA